MNGLSKNSPVFADVFFRGYSLSRRGLDLQLKGVVTAKRPSRQTHGESVKAFLLPGRSPRPPP